MRTRAGVTLIELVVVLAIVSTAALVVAPQLHAPNRAPSLGDVGRDLQRRAARDRRPVTTITQTADGARWMTAWPNGLLVVDSARHSVPRAAWGEHAR